MNPLFRITTQLSNNQKTNTEITTLLEQSGYKQKGNFLEKNLSLGRSNNEIIVSKIALTEESMSIEIGFTSISKFLLYSSIATLFISVILIFISAMGIFTIPNPALAKILPFYPVAAVFVLCYYFLLLKSKFKSEIETLQHLIFTKVN